MTMALLPSGPTAPAATRDLGAVGRVGDLVLEYARTEGRTVLARSSCTTPWHLLPPMDLDGTGCACTFLVNPSGGLVGGDRLSLRATLAPGAHALLTTPSATRIYGGREETTVQTFEAEVGRGGILEWVPDVAIPYAGARFRQSLRVALGPGAVAVVWDALASGRMARGERWAFACADTEVRITTASGRVLLDRAEIVPEAGRIAALGLEEWNYVGNLYLVGDGVEPAAWKRLESEIAGLLDARGGAVLGGVSEPAAPGLAVRLAARTGSDLAEIAEALWAVVRQELWSFPPAVLRRY